MLSLSGLHIEESLIERWEDEDDDINGIDKSNGDSENDDINSCLDILLHFLMI